MPHETFELPSPRYTKRSLATTVADLRRGAARLAPRIHGGARDPSLLAAFAGYKEARPRLVNSLAFGQHPELMPHPQTAQFGLYGTSAALELFAASSCTQRLWSDPDAPSFSSDDKAWCRDVCKTLLFLHVALRELPELGHERCAAQAGSTLRLAHALRALTEIRPFIVRLGDRRFREAAALPDDLVAEFDALAGGDWASGFVDSLIAHTSAMLKAVTTNCGDPRTEGRPYCAGQTAQVVVHSYTSTERDVPHSLNQWAFVTASVAVAVRRAAGAGVLNSDALEIITGETLGALVQAIKTEGLLDPRVRVFAAWALSEPDGANLPAQLTTAPYRADLAAAVSSLGPAMAGNPVLLTDVHVPYYLNIRSSEGVTTQRDDYLVVPVVPALLLALANLRPNLLAHRRVLGLAITVRDALLETDREGEPLPYQVGEEDGTVNLLYYHQAARAVADALEGKVKRPLLKAVRFEMQHYVLEGVLFTVAVALLLVGPVEWGLGMVAWGIPKLLDTVARRSRRRRQRTRLLQRPK